MLRVTFLSSKFVPDMSRSSNSVALLVQIKACAGLNHCERWTPPVIDSWLILSLFLLPSGDKRGGAHFVVCFNSGSSIAQEPKVSLECRGSGMLLHFPEFGVLPEWLNW